MFSPFSFMQSSDSEDADTFSANDFSSSANDFSSSANDLENDRRGGIGLSDPELSQRRRDMLDLVNRLHSTGVQIDMDLPQIAVIGSQSAGKSSLIESISDIKLPRASGTCTRCPTECKLSYSNSDWKCIVSLRFITDHKGQPLAQVHDQLFGATIYDPNEVEERIRRAQRAILSGSTNYRKFLEGEDESLEEPRLSFSANCVSLQISGRHLADLSFCDLPGIIASVGQGGNTDDIELVQDLVTSYISKPSCIILLTVACETDFENQGAHHLAKIYDPDGTRTIGVLTKPDRIPQGEEDRWLRFIKGDLEPLSNGWYCVKQPNSLSHGITWEEARDQEKKYFSSTAPWCSLEAPYQERLRTNNLTERLSIILSELISRRLPDLQVELKKLYRNTEQDLQLLPKPPSKNPCQDVLNLISNFTIDLSKHLEGIPDEEGLLQAIIRQQASFRRVIRATPPNFRPYERRHFIDGLVEDIFDQEVAERLDVATEVQGDTIFLDDVFNRAQRARTRELPDVYPSVVREFYISPVIEKWKDPALDYFEAVDKILCHHIKELIRKHFGSFGNGKLQRKIQSVVSEHIKKCGDQTKEKVIWLTLIERRPFSLNQQYFYDYKDDYLSFYQSWGQRGRNDQPDQASTPDQQNSASAQIPTGSPQAGITGTNAADLTTDAMGPALDVMAGVRAYLQVACKRFTDNIPLATDRDFVLGVGEDISTVLQEALKIGDPEGIQICKDLVQQPSDISARRKELQKKLSRLDEARKELNAFEL
jgi:GTP-binding protein EngB required for normal cell division